jgi:hypothetical protein
VGVVTGQLASDLEGESGIREGWLANLAWPGRMVAVADALLTSSARHAAIRFSGRTTTAKQL